MLTRQKKENIVKDIAQKIKDSKSVVFSDFRGLKVKEMTAIRKELRVSDVEFSVIRKTLLNIALKEAGIADADVRKMEGQVAVAIAPDEVAAAKILAKAGKTNENIKILGGILDARPVTGEEVMNLAKLPSREELLAKFVGTINAPVSGFVNVLAGNIRGFVNVLNAISQAKQ